MDRYKLIAAEVFGYSYDNYENHFGNLRYDALMPNDIELLEKAEAESWSHRQIADKVEIPVEEIPLMLKKFHEAKDIVDSPTPAESFRRGVRVSIKNALEEGLSSEEDIEELINQICYRAADLGYLLKNSHQQLSEYSDELRKTNEKHN